MNRLLSLPWDEEGNHFLWRKKYTNVYLQSKITRLWKDSLYPLCIWETPFSPSTVGRTPVLSQAGSLFLPKSDFIPHVKLILASPLLGICTSWSGPCPVQDQHMRPVNFSGRPPTRFPSVYAAPVSELMHLLLSETSPFHLEKTQFFLASLT